MIETSWSLGWPCNVPPNWNIFEGKKKCYKPDCLGKLGPVVILVMIHRGLFHVPFTLTSRVWSFGILIFYGKRLLLCFPPCAALDFEFCLFSPLLSLGDCLNRVSHFLWIDLWPHRFLFSLYLEIGDYLSCGLFDTFKILFSFYSCFQWELWSK